MSRVEESLYQQLFPLINGTDSQSLEGDKRLSTTLQRRCWWGFTQQDGNFELNPRLLCTECIALVVERADKEKRENISVSKLFVRIVHLMTLWTF